MQQTDNLEQFQQNYLNLKKIVVCVNNIIQPVKKNMFNYLNDKHNNKLDQAIDDITQDNGNKMQQQIVYGLFKRVIYYFDNIQFDLGDQFWQKAKGLMQIDFKIIDSVQKAKIYKNLLHLIFDYQKRIQQQQEQLYLQKKQAQRVKKVLKQKQRVKKQKDAQKLKKQEEQRQKEQYLIDQYDKMTEIIEQDFKTSIQKLNLAKEKVNYSISKQRRIQKTRQKLKQKKFSSYNPHVHTPKKPKKPKTAGRSY